MEVFFLDSRLTGGSKMEVFFHDFGDGVMVEASHHSNGGGIVAKSATVDSSCYIGPKATVYGNASVLNGCRLTHTVKVHGNAIVKTGVLLQDTVEVFGNAEVQNVVDIFGECKISKAPIVITGFVGHPVIITDNCVIVGCHSMTFDEWHERGQAMMRYNGFPTKTVRKLYEYINTLIDLHSNFYDPEDLVTTT